MKTMVLVFVGWSFHEVRHRELGASGVVMGRHSGIIGFARYFFLKIDNNQQAEAELSQNQAVIKVVVQYLLRLCGWLENWGVTLQFLENPIDFFKILMKHP